MSSIGSRVSVHALLFMLGLGLAALPASAYMGGPILAHVAGIEPGTDRVFYYLTYHDESASGPEVWFFDLNGENPEQPQRALSLEGRDDDLMRSQSEISEAWRLLSATLRPLSSFPQFDLRITLSSDSVGVDSLWQSPVYRGHLTVQGQGVGQVCDLTIFCEPMIVVRALYALPGREEAIAVVSYIGRAYGCEEVEQPVLLTPAAASALVPQREGETTGGAAYHPEPFVFGKKSMRGCCAGQFKGGFVEAGPPESPVFSYLAFEEVMVTPPQVWVITLVGGNSTQPIRYSLSGEDSLDTYWNDLGAVRRIGGRGGDLVARDPVDLHLRLTTESIGVDSVCGAPCYRGDLVAQTPSGRGIATLTMFCNTTIHVRGVYPLPASCELVIVTYTGKACGCGQKDMPIVIYPSE